MNNDEDLVRQPGPRRDRGASNLPNVDASMGDDLELESGLGSRTEARVPLAHREPAQVRHRETSSPSSSRAVRPRFPKPPSSTVSYRKGWLEEVAKYIMAAIGHIYPTTSSQEATNVTNVRMTPK